MVAVIRTVQGMVKDGDEVVVFVPGPRGPFSVSIFAPLVRALAKQADPSSALVMPPVEARHSTVMNQAGAQRR